MTTELSPEAARAAWDAELQLQKLDAHENLAVLYSQEKSEHVRSALGERHQNEVGVHPDHREEFREALFRVLNGGGMPVADVIDVLNRR